jgi:hypothetical protein
MHRRHENREWETSSWNEFAGERKFGEYWEDVEFDIITVRLEKVQKAIGLTEYSDGGANAKFRKL